MLRVVTLRERALRTGMLRVVTLRERALRTGMLRGGRRRRRGGAGKTERVSGR